MDDGIFFGGCLVFLLAMLIVGILYAVENAAVVDEAELSAPQQMTDNPYDNPFINPEDFK